jgi:hypothetical protein
MVASASDILGARALLIHCEDEAAKAFYRHLGDFEASPGDPLHLFLADERPPQDAGFGGPRLMSLTALVMGAQQSSGRVST